MKLCHIFCSLTLILLFVSPPASHAASQVDRYELVLTSVVGNNGVHWNRLNDTAKSQLNSYLSSVAAQDLSKLKNKNEKLAFWINAHNACVMKLIVERLPIQDIMAIEGFRDRLTCKIAGQDLSLHEIYGKHIRPTHSDPRVLFALWWGVRGGPALRSKPYEGKTLDQTLNDQVRQTLQRSEFVTVGTEQVVLSPLLDWYKWDFGKSEDAFLQFIRRHVSDEVAQEIPLRYSKVGFSALDWSLDQAKE